MYVCVASNTLGQSNDAALLTVAGNFVEFNDNVDD